MGRFLLLASWCAAPYAFGQSNFAGVRGTVVDPQDNPVAGSEVQLTATATHAVRRAVSAEQGIFEITPLWPLEYELAVHSPAFPTLYQTLRLQAHQHLSSALPPY